MGTTPYVIGIAGGTGAGKTTVAEAVTETVDERVPMLSVDNYYRDRSHLSPAEREVVNYDHPDAIDWDLLVGDLGAICEGRAIEVPHYDFETHTRARTGETVRPAPVVVLEGIFALYHDEVLAHVDLPIYVHTDPDVRVLRRLRRDVLQRGRELDGVIDQYLATVKPMHEEFVEPTRRNADVIIPEGANETAVELIREKVRRER